MTMTNRRWFRFSLRTLFVVVTLFGVWLGWQRHIVQERKALIAELDQIDPEFHHETLESLEKRTGRIDTFDYARIPIVRKWLGDETVLRVWLPNAANEDLAYRAERAFPEAKIFGTYGYDFRDSLYAPVTDRKPNRGALFHTGLIEK